MQVYARVKRPHGPKLGVCLDGCLISKQVNHNAMTQQKAFLGTRRRVDHRVKQISSQSCHRHPRFRLKKLEVFIQGQPYFSVVRGSTPMN